MKRSAHRYKLWRWNTAWFGVIHVSPPIAIYWISIHLPHKLVSFSSDPSSQSLLPSHTCWIFYIHLSHNLVSSHLIIFTVPTSIAHVLNVYTLTAWFGVILIWSIYSLSFHSHVLNFYTLTAWFGVILIWPIFTVSPPITHVLNVYTLAVSTAELLHGAARFGRGVRYQYKKMDA